jgi:hypothetical protein
VGDKRKVTINVWGSSRTTKNKTEEAVKINNVKGKGKVLPRTGHEGSEGE